MNWRLPNQLTVGRLALSAAFFVLLGLHEPAAGPAHLLLVALALFVLAGVSDVLDGYLARKWGVTSAFGRILDPYVDKVLICGAFVLLTGGNYTFHEAVTTGFERGLPAWLTGNMASSVQAWMVVAVITREFVVSGIRGYSESLGRKFPATIWGKLKMFSQSFAIGSVLVFLGCGMEAPWLVVVKVSAVWISVIVTVLSGLAYIGKARALLAAGR
jgi:phosphatidylglycerophosphate synthase